MNAEEVKPVEAVEKKIEVPQWLVEKLKSMNRIERRHFLIENGALHKRGAWGFLKTSKEVH